MPDRYISLEEFVAIQQVEHLLQTEEVNASAETGEHKKGGSDSRGLGYHEIASTPLATAMKVCNSLAMQYQKKLAKEMVPDIASNYNLIRRMVLASGVYERQDMPVIDSVTVKKLQGMLRSNYLYTHDMFGKNDPYKEKLKVAVTSDLAKNLKPLQRQIYLEKGFVWVAKDGVEQQTKNLDNLRLVISQDNFIVDGHHRWLTAMLMKTTLPLHVFRVSLKAKELMTMMNDYSDHIGNIRNI